MKFFNFSRNWVSYEKGFGEPGVGFWFGNINMHTLTFNRSYALRIEAPFYPGVFAEYDSFKVSSPLTNYILQLGKYGGNAGDLISNINNSAFSTWDRDNDKADEACARRNEGAWWYGKSCIIQDLNSMQGLISVAMKAKELLRGNGFQ